jgi:hypothetical protein
MEIYRLHPIIPSPFWLGYGQCKENLAGEISLFFPWDFEFSPDTFYSRRLYGVSE